MWHVILKNFAPRFTCNSEVFASELLENIEEMLPHYLYTLMSHE